MLYEDQQRLEHLPALDGLRAISILTVISAHMHDHRFQSAALGGIGVHIFFVLSGFLITRLALIEEAATGFLSLKGFYIRRIFRILPPYVLCLLAYFILLFVLKLQPERAEAVRAVWPIYFLFLQDLDPTYQGLPFGHSWSLAVEEKFYLLWPMIAFLWLRSLPDARRLLTLLLYFTLYASIVISSGEFVYIHGYKSIIAGCCLALVAQHRASFDTIERFRAMLPSFVSSLAMVLLPLAAYWWYSTPIGWFFLELSTVFVVYLTTVEPSSPLTKALLTPVMLLIGRWSYAMYLFHRLVLNGVERYLPPDGPLSRTLLAFLSAVVLSALVAWPISRFIERPCIEYGRRWARGIKAGQMAESK